MTPDILAIDLGSIHMGWAISYGNALLAGEEKFKGTLDERLGQFYLWLKPRVPLQTIAFDKPFVPHGANNAQAALHGLAGVIRAVGAAAGVEVIPLLPAVWKKAATGHGKASKGQVMEWAKREIHRECGEHEADALAILVAAMRREKA